MYYDYLTQAETNPLHLPALTPEPSSPLTLEGYPIFLRCSSALSNADPVSRALSSFASLQSGEMISLKKEPSVSSLSSLGTLHRKSTHSSLKPSTELSPAQWNYSIKPLPPIPVSRPSSPSSVVARNGSTLVRRRTAPQSRPTEVRPEQRHALGPAQSRRRTLANTPPLPPDASNFGRPSAQPVTRVRRQAGSTLNSSNPRLQQQDLHAERKRWGMYEAQFNYYFFGL
ncbi:hypothetical protein FRC03_002074 [Tulasnella sp. 419]|nr:hypothetical protein FRC03_002074 [Tulasnella sp. 419]